MSHGLEAPSPADLSRPAVEPIVVGNIEPDGEAHSFVDMARDVGAGTLYLVGAITTTTLALVAARRVSPDISFTTGRHLEQVVEERLKAGEITKHQATVDRQKIRASVDPDEAYDGSEPIPLPKKS